MMRQDQIAEVIDRQMEVFLEKKDGLNRSLLNDLPIIENFATIITGIRRCGKSTLLVQVLKSKFKTALYLNFEDIRLSEFNTDDFTRLQKEFETRKLSVLFFDEIQIIDKWEIFVSQLIREGYRVFITGSNASLLSRELGTYLTGRHLSKTLYPFSYSEFLEFKKAKAGKKSLLNYMQTGGFPEYVKNNNPMILSSLVDDIIYRDISVRYGVREVDSLKQLLVYLMSNIGKPVSANKLKGLFGIKSVATFIEYFSYFEDTYLLDFLPQFSYSIKAQARNPKKVYTIDTGLLQVVSTSFTEDNGRKLENLIFIYLLQNELDVFYFKGMKECDFVTFKKNALQDIIQVCYEVNDDTFGREFDGLIEAMKFFKVDTGTIVTLDQKDKITKDGMTVNIVPAHEFMMR